ncbi:MAG: hypothetical protein KDC98_24550 [Planctomycetes bacterium]|nr:hypothetical protein [Planctomycetota bacterium]
MRRPLRMLLPLVFAATVTAQGKNLLFYGNSYSFFSWGYGVPELVQLIAIEAGQPSPTFVARLVGGSDLQFHATDPNQVAAITTSLPPGQTWDHVVLQGMSLEATNQGGYSAAQFRSNAVAITTNVRNHSPAAGAVTYQTWARAWGHGYYPVPWVDPMAMHDEVRGNYRLAVADINTTFGAGTAVNAAVGDGMALLEWDPAWYDPDLSHPGPAMTLLAAMCIYTSIYGRTVCEIGPAFSPPGPLALSLAGQGLTEPDWNLLAGIADRCADPAVRSYPGSGDHLLLESAVGTVPLTACHDRRMTIGTSVQLSMRSMNGVYDGAPAWLIGDLIATGSPPGPSTSLPEIQVDTGSMVILGTAATLASPLSFAVQMPLSLPGYSVLVQGVAWQSSTATGNAWLTATDAHEFRFF